MRPLPSLLLLLLGSLAGSVAAQEAPFPESVGTSAAELTPGEAVRLGLEHNRRIQAARADAEGARAAAREVQADRRPAIRLRGDVRHLVGAIPEAEFTLPGVDTTFSILPIPRDQVHSEISIEQPLFQGMRLRNRALAAEHQADAATARVEQEEAEVALAVRMAWWNLYRAMAVRDATEAALARAEAHARDVDNLFQEGVVLRADLLAARTRRSQVGLDALEASNAVRVARLELNRLIGRPLESELRPAPAEVPASVEGELEELTERALADRPGLLALAREVRALEREVGITRGTWLPEISLVGRYVYARPNPLVFADLDRFRGIGEAGVVLRWSLFEGGRRVAGTARAQARLTAAEERLEDARETVAVEVARCYVEAVQAEELLEAAARHREEAEETHRVVQSQFAEGVVLPAQVLEAEQVRRGAESREAEARAEHAIRQAALLAALGRVW